MSRFQDATLASYLRPYCTIVLGVLCTFSDNLGGIGHHNHKCPIPWSIEGNHYLVFSLYSFDYNFSVTNYADPVYGVATICHQVRCLRWGHPSLFHTAMSLLICYEMFCMRDISYRLIWMKYINMLSVYAQSGTHRPFNWWIIAVFT